MLKQKYNSKNIKELLELTFVDLFIELNSHFMLEECPITSILQKQLTVGESFPDAIIKHEDGKRFFVEVVTASRSKEMRENIGKQHSGLIRPNYTIRSVENLAYVTQKTVMQISDAIRKKCDKKYSHFASIAGTEPRGILIVKFINSDVFLDECEFKDICSRFTPSTLQTLGCGYSCFDQVFLMARVYVKDIWKEQLFRLADLETMKYLRLQK